MLNHDLRYFKLSEFKHPEKVNAVAAFWLDEIRHVFGHPITLTDDARLPGDRPSGSSATSWHFDGRAFDLRIRDWPSWKRWDFVKAVQKVADMIPESQQGIELEMVWSDRDKHAHIGFALDGRRNELEIAAD